MVLAFTLCNVGRQNNSKKRNWMLTIFYGNGSTPNNTSGYGRSHMTSKISRENGLEHRIDRIVSFGLS